LVTFAWVFFRAPDFANAQAILKGVFIPNAKASNWLDIWTPLSALGLLVLLEFSYRKQRFDGLLNKFPGWLRWGIYLVLLFILLAFSGTQKFTFIYFQF
jgi:hypothetical protein